MELSAGAAKAAEEAVARILAELEFFQNPTQKPA
jgi:hypothetical protein